MSNGQSQVSTLSAAPESNGNGTPAIECRHLHRYFGRLKAVNDVSFCAYRGQVMGFIGPNGAGKTTTMRILATLDVPTSGDAFVNGYSVIDDPDKVRKIVGFMPDSFGRYSNMNVLEYIDYFARAYNLAPRGATRSNACSVFTELKKLVEKPITALSKGMSQRLGLARTLINDPAVLILDEPAAGLDPRARIELRELVRLLARELKKTVLISSHILTELGEICDSAAIIEAGRILASGTIDEIQQAHRATQGRATGAAVSVRVLRDVDRLERLLLEQPLVSGVTVVAQTAAFEFSGDDAALCGLLRHLIREELDVVEFRGRSETLEDAFLAITKGVTRSSALNAAIGRLEAVGDHCNAIVVKEVRQGLKSRQFVGTFVLLLMVSWGGSIFLISMEGDSLEYGSSAQFFFILFFLILCVASLIIVPFAAFRSIVEERAENTLELVQITALSPRQIIWGKSLSALVQVLVYFSAITPFIAFTSLLPGFDFVHTAFDLGALLIASFVFSSVALAIGGADQEQNFASLRIDGRDRAGDHRHDHFRAALLCVRHHHDVG